MIDSIQHQLDAVRGLLAEAGSGASAGVGQPSPKSEPSPADYLSDSEEDALGKAFALTPEERTSLLAEMTARISEGAIKGTPDVSVSNQS